MKIYKITPSPGLNTHCEKTIKAAMEGVQGWIEEGDIGDIVTVEIIEMEEADYDALPEYMGP